MNLGFETTGNATLVFHDGGPLLVTDPWLSGSAFFGSWGMSHEIPDRVMESILASEYVWISHRHPDHLHGPSLDRLGGKTFLVPDHAGGVIARGLRERGFHAEVMKDRKWYYLSRNVRALCIADYNQDAILLVDVGGTLVVNLNDASDHGWGPFVRKIISRYEHSFLLCLTGYGDTDMINLWREDGSFIEPRAARRRPIGRTIARLNREWGSKYFIPFSSMHVYERADSAWARQYHADLHDYEIGFDSESSTLLPPYIACDVERCQWSPLSPRPRSHELKQPEEFGDNWSDQLDHGDKRRIWNYFRAAEHMADELHFIAVRCGGKDYVVELRPSGFTRGITFEAPRTSLMAAIENQAFDELLIGNFMRTVLHGEFHSAPLYPHIGEYLAKFADNAGAKTMEEVNDYLAEYRNRAPLSFIRHRLERATIEAVRYNLREDTLPYRVAAEAYHRMRNPGLLVHDLAARFPSLPSAIKAVQKLRTE